jgi:hypothetical protein
MKPHMSVLIAAGVLLLTAAHAASQEMPKPSPEMAKLDFFEGNWACEGKINENPMGPAGKLSSTVRIQKDLGGFWQSGAVKGTMANMPPFEGMFHTTYDPAAKQFMMLWVDNMGGWSRSTSTGWQGDKLVYQGESNMPGQKPMKSRDTFTKGGDGGMKHAWEMQVGGKWTALGEETCTKK